MSKCIFCDKNEATLFRPYRGECEEPVMCQKCKDKGKHDDMRWTFTKIMNGANTEMYIDRQKIEKGDTFNVDGIELTVTKKDE